MAAFTALVVGLSSILVWRLADLQLVHGATYAREAMVNRVHRVPVVAERGVIYDRQGVQLVINQPAWSLAVTTIALPLDNAARSAELDQLAQLAGLTRTQLADKLSQDADAFRPYALKTGLTGAEAQTVNERLPRLPGASLQLQAIRHYLQPHLFSHLSRVG